MSEVYENLDKQEAAKLIAEQIEIAQNAINLAQQIADQTGSIFEWGGPKYGMGGTYYGEGWNDSSCWEESDSESGWRSSSEFC